MALSRKRHHLYSLRPDIAVIPEGLPVSVTLSLTVIAKAMGKSKVLCKSLTTVQAEFH